MKQQQQQQQLPGLDLQALADWLPGAVEGAGTGLGATLIAGGKSNLTYALSDGDKEWILRRPPLGHVLATAHDMAREYRIISALADTGVPVPRAYAFCEDQQVLGAPFYLMERVEGTPYRRADELNALGPERTRAISERLVDVLVTLHSVDPRQIGLDDFGRPDGYLERQVHRWKKQLDASFTRELPTANELHRQLAAAVPPQSRSGIVHGDFRLDNILIDAADRPRAVLDWEMATLGDPLCDLALMLTYHRLGSAAVTDVANAEGFSSEAQIIERYAARSDRDLSNFGFYLGLAAYKLAAIVEGIHYRHVHGQTVGAGFDNIGESIHPLLQAGLDALKGGN
ncbi:phosphotransferase family protein [Glutamicibacter halophytocola]|uniref:phosphotransferase family protein n=1 Tax=Glutamicibacter halophytocola TaxID=1933880 RepID=UPI001559B8C7|nr:phosphotransferase family protein [Glutamicibacter halophytocola]NQD39801.1 phosphotransferase family protein [Glutamicibacter halophytocola]